MKNEVSLITLTQVISFFNLGICRDWANEYGRVEGSWDMWMCSMPSGYYPDCGGMAWMPGDVSFMGEHSWYAPYGAGAGPSGEGSNGILHEVAIL